MQNYVRWEHIVLFHQGHEFTKGTFELQRKLLTLVACRKEIIHNCTETYM